MSVKHLLSTSCAAHRSVKSGERCPLPSGVSRERICQQFKTFFFTKAAGKHMDTGLIIPALYMLTGRNASGADAATSKSLWFLLAWGPIEESVRTLQVRIAKAAKSKPPTNPVHHRHCYAPVVSPGFQFCGNRWWSSPIFVSVMRESTSASQISGFTSACLQAEKKV